MIEAIKRILPALFHDRPAVASIQPISEGRGHRVWKVTTRTGIVLAVKHQPFARLTQGLPYDLLEVERTVCDLLRPEGCPVPEVYGTDAAHGLIFLEWCGDRTLDDICQESPPHKLSDCADRVVDGLLSVEKAFETHLQAFSPMAFPGCDPDGLGDAWREVTEPATGALPDLIARLTGRPPPARVQRLWSELVRTLAQASPALGPTDYNARNIVVNTHTGGIRFLEFSKLGWDWPERRLVQYATGLGAGRADGGFHGLIDAQAAACYAGRAAKFRGVAPAEIAHRLDGHHVVFHVLAGYRLLAALSNPSEGQALLRVWQNPEVRLAQIGQALAIPLSDEPSIGKLRALFVPE